MLFNALTDQDIVYHFICLTNPVESWKDPFIEVDINLKASIQLFDLAAKANVKKIVFPSSGGTVYGPQNLPVNEEETIPQPSSPYGIVKLATEHFLQYYKKHHEISVDIYRISNAYGPRQALNRQQGVIPIWIRKILEDKPISVFGDNNTIRDYIYVEDIAQLMTHSLSDLNSSGTFNLGSGIGVSILQLLEIFKKSIDKPFSYNIHVQRDSDIQSIVLDNSKILSHFPEFEFQKLEGKIVEMFNQERSIIQQG